MQRRVVITSIGIVSSLGNTPDDIISNLRGGKTAFCRTPLDSDVVICPVNNFDLKAFTGRFKYLRYLSRGAQLGLSAALLAVKNSGLIPAELSEAGIFAGTGPNLDFGTEFPEIKNGELDSDRLPALWILKFLPNTLVSVLAQICGINGDNLTINTACSASMQAIGEAYHKIKNGYLNIALAGGGDSRINRGGILSYKKAHALYTGDVPPEQACRPFDRKRNGFIPGEGGAFFIVEDLENAIRRGSAVLAEICGYSASIDGYNMTAPMPDGTYAEKAIKKALSEAEIKPEHIDLICAHGTGTPLNDDAESAIIWRIFENKIPPVTALKSWIGHGAAACGALELAISIICQRNNFMPYIKNLENPCNDSINFIKNSIDRIFDYMLLLNFGFGGQNSALVIQSYKD